MTDTDAKPLASDICFVDTETMGLDEDAPIWEFAAIRRDAATGEETSLQLFIRHNPGEWLSSMDSPFREDYERRYRADVAEAEHVAAGLIYGFLQGTNIVGAVPSFDATRLARLLERHGLVATTRERRLKLQSAGLPYRLPWHYHLNDVETMAIGWLHGVAARAVDEARMRGEEPHPKMANRKLDPPWKSDELSVGLGVDPTQFERHTAMGDVKWVRAQYDVITGLTGQCLPCHAEQDQTDHPGLLAGKQFVEAITAEVRQTMSPYKTGQKVAFTTDAGRTITGTVTNVRDNTDGSFELTIEQFPTESVTYYQVKD